MKKTRIIERIAPNKSKEYVIQQKHFLFRWWWVDAWVNSSSGANCTDSFNTPEEAKENLCWFDGTKSKEKIIEENGNTLNT